MQEKKSISVERLIEEAAKNCARDPAAITLVAVSKGHDASEIEVLYNKGQRIFGESRVQEADEKRLFLPQDIEWHLIGTLQAKKVNKVIGKYALIHSVHRVELALKLSQASQAKGIVTNILLQVNPLGEETKHGFSIQELYDVFPVLLTQPGIKLKGLMAMAPNTNDRALIKKCFSKTQEACLTLQRKYALPHFKELSMGMSQDYDIAIACGATLVRIGSLLWSNPLS